MNVPVVTTQAEIVNVMSNIGNYKPDWPNDNRISVFKKLNEKFKSKVDPKTGEFYLRYDQNLIQEDIYIASYPDKKTWIQKIKEYLKIK
jgi:hypothetical protein